MKLIKLYLSILLISCAGWLSYAAENNPANGLYLNWLDANSSPANDFFAYANGTWQTKNPIPPEYGRWGIFTVLKMQNQQRIHQILQQAAKQAAEPGSIQQKVGDFYRSGMDEVSINRLGISPLKTDLSRINELRDINDVLTVLPSLHLKGVNVLFNFASMQDFKDSSKVIGSIQQAGLGLPDREYYLKKDSKSEQIRALYLEHMKKMFLLMNDSPPVAVHEGTTVMAIETALAKASMSLIEQRDPEKIYHLLSLTELETLLPNFSWPRYFSTIGQPQLKQINLAMPEYFKTLNTLLLTISIEEWKAYLRWHLLNASAPYLSQPFVDEDFRMNAALTGTKKLLPRWQRVVDDANSALGFALGKLYVERYFSAAAKEKTSEILTNIRQALYKDLQTLPWITASTRKAANQKLGLIEDRVGYPEQWWDYSSLQIDRGAYIANIWRANEFLLRRDLNKIDKPVDRSEWLMAPQTVNAYYDPSMNSLTIPAGILQPPFFDIGAPAAVNYGGIGFVIGHEITHGFDDQGAKFDGQGNLKNWWTQEDEKKFQAATNCVVEQFSNYKVADNFPVQGKLVVGEAVADLGGLTLAYNAFHASTDFQKAKTIAGFTPDQQFFLGAAHIWASNVRQEQARYLATIDPHPPMIYRVNGTLANMPQFQKAFGITNPGPMVNATRCVIW